MGNQKQKWTAEEEEALLAGVAKHGPGKWKNILKDPDFAPFLTHRSNIDLKARASCQPHMKPGKGYSNARMSCRFGRLEVKALSHPCSCTQDKWRNLSVSTAQQGSKDKSRTPKLKTIVAAPLSNAPNSAPAASLARTTSSGTVMDDLSNSALDGKNGPRFNAMIFEAISTIKDTNGSDIGAIVNFIEERHDVPTNFRRLLGSRLRRLVSQGKLEKVQNCYKIRKDTSLGAKTPTPKQKDVRLRLPQNYLSMTSGETVEEASITAAYRIAEAENKSFLASEAVKEAERVSKMAEDTNAMLQLVKEIYEQCARGEIVVLA